MKNYDKVIEELAKTGYETHFDEEWDKLSQESIDRTMWKVIALNMLNRLRELYKKENS